MSPRGLSPVELVPALVAGAAVGLLGGGELRALGVALLLAAAAVLRRAPRARRAVWSAGWSVLGTIGALLFVAWSFWLPRDERRAVWAALQVAVRARRRATFDGIGRLSPEPVRADAPGSRINGDRSPGGSRSPAAGS